MKPEIVPDFLNLFFACLNINAAHQRIKKEVVDVWFPTSFPFKE